MQYEKRFSNVNRSRLDLDKNEDLLKLLSGNWDLGSRP